MAAPAAATPEFLFSAPEVGEGPPPLVMSLSATIPSADVTAALPGGTIAAFSIATPSIAMVRIAASSMWSAIRCNHISVRLKPRNASRSTCSWPCPPRLPSSLARC